MNRAERAAEYHKKGYNCAQAIVCAFCDKAGLDEENGIQGIRRSWSWCQ